MLTGLLGSDFLPLLDRYTREAPPGSTSDPGSDGLAFFDSLRTVSPIPDPVLLEVFRHRLQVRLNRSALRLRIARLPQSQAFLCGLTARRVGGVVGFVQFRRWRVLTKVLVLDRRKR
jgi:hypothetical protein